MPADFRRFGPAAELGGSNGGAAASGVTPDTDAATGATDAAAEGLDECVGNNDGSSYGVYEGAAYEEAWNAIAPSGSAGTWNANAPGSSADEAAAQEQGAPLQELPASAAGDPQGDQPAAAAEGSGSTCDVKGNISASGDRIYHTPGSPAYNATTIDQRRGERWFCSAEEAEAAGWRAPRGR